VQRADETPAQAFAAGEGNPGSSVKGTEPTENLEPAGKRVAERSVHTPEKEVGPALKKIRDAKEPETDFAAAPIPRRRPKRADLLPELETLGQRLSVQEPPGTSWPVARAERSNVKATREGAKNSADKSKSDERTISSLSFENRGGQLGTASGNRTGEVRELNYQDRVLLWLKQHGAYPYEAAMYRLQDTVMLKFAINRDGKILYYQLTKKSKWHLLNRAVERMMDRSSPVPPIPPEISKNEITFTVPVEFDPKLRE
jgi:protein TonB